MKRLTKRPVAIMILVLLVLFLSVSISYADIDSAPVGKWMLDGSGDDSSGYGNHGTVYNSPRVLDGIHRQAYYFDKFDDQYIEVPDSPYLNFGTGSFSISCWFNTSNSYQWMTLVDKRGLNGANIVGYQLLLYYGSVSFIMSDAAGSTNYSDETNYYDYKWHNLIVTVNRGVSNSLKIYVDGECILTDIPRTGSLTNNLPFRIGASSSINNENFQGTIDEVMVYHGLALSEEEIQEINLNGADWDNLVGQYVNCTAKWNLDGNGADSSGNTNHGTLSGPTLPEINAGVHNWGLKFNGSNYISVPNHATLNYGVGEYNPYSFTISFWIKADRQKTYHTIIDKRTEVDATYTGYMVALYNGKPLLQLADGTSWYNFYPAVAPRFDDGEWYFMVFSLYRYSGNLNIYVFKKSNGTSYSYNFDTSPIAGDITNASDLYIGKHMESAANYFEGTLDDIKMYNKSLTLSDATEQFEAHQ